MTKKLSQVLLMACFLGSNLLIGVADDERPARPHIVLILADDLGYGDLRAFNPQSKITTPHLDALAKAGMCFTDAHSGGSTCRPSRYSLLTGRFAARRERFNDRTGVLIAEDRPTVASMLRDCGYRTAMVGKWHLGFHRMARANRQGAEVLDFDYQRPLTGGPVDRGFDSFFGMHASLDIPPYFYIRDRTAVTPPSDTVAARSSVGDGEGWNRIQGAFWRAGKVAPDFKHAEVTPRFADEASELIERHGDEQPLFLYLALPSPHTPWLPTTEFVGKSGAGSYGDFVMTVDHVVGQVLASLDKAGLSDQTLVMFSSDNGPVWYEKDVEKFAHRSAGPLRGIKGSVWEGGHRVPFIVRWPGHVQAGVTSHRTIAFADVFATLAEAAGDASLGEAAAEDSESFLSTLLDPNEAVKGRSPILHGAKVIRDGDWKLINTSGSRGFDADRNRKYGVELYNLRDDLSEENNLAATMPAKVESLKGRLRELLDNPHADVSGIGSAPDNRSTQDQPEGQSGDTRKPAPADEHGFLVRIDTGPMSETERARRIARIFGSPENFEKYRLSQLIRRRAAQLGSEARMFYYGTEGKRARGNAMLHQLMVEMKLPHHYVFESTRPHRWDSGWIPMAVEFLMHGSPIDVFP